MAYGAPHGLTHYRVDKMTEITATGVPRESNDETRSFDPAVYSQQVFGMFRGEQCRMKLRFENSLAGVVLDRFGRERLLVPDGPDHFIFQWDEDSDSEVDGAAGKDRTHYYAEIPKDIPADALPGDRGERAAGTEAFAFPSNFPLQCPVPFAIMTYWL